MLAIWLLVPLPCSLYIWKFLAHILLKPSWKDFEHNFASMWNECNCMVVGIFFGIAFLWDWNENWPFPVPWPLMSFANLLPTECSAFIGSSFRILNISAWILLFPLALSIVMLPKAHLISYPECPALGDWQHHRGYPGHYNLSSIVLCIPATCS